MTFMQKHINFYTETLDETGKAQAAKDIAQIGKSGQWNMGSNIAERVIEACACVCGFSITIVKSTSMVVLLQPHETTKSNGHLFVCWLATPGKEHYNLLVPQTSM
jgi:hypothetical protein